MLTMIQQIIGRRFLKPAFLLAHWLTDRGYCSATYALLGQRALKTQASTASSEQSTPDGTIDGYCSRSSAPGFVYKEWLSR